MLLRKLELLLFQGFIYIETIFLPVLTKSKKKKKTTSRTLNT